MTNKTSQKTTREKAAAAKAEADARQRRVDNRNRLLGVVVIVALVALIFGGVWYSKKGNAPTAAPTADANATLPTGVDKTTYGVPYGNAPTTVPQLQLWEDFQCPICGELEKANGTGITGLADAGKIRLLWRPTTFIDDNQNNQSSQQAAQAWGCAIDAGKAKEYHSTVFANQPATEGTGWTQAQLLDFGTKAGITGAAYDTFKSCVDANTYASWVANSRQAFDQTAVPGTPTGYLVMAGKSNKELDYNTLHDPAALQAAITAFEGT
ncbi:MAG TPA: thioredoxin domain-containing protein [Candidatus Nanopelagicales bacterium]|jgi:protein-disulfide isomerase